MELLMKKFIGAMLATGALAFAPFAAEAKGCIKGAVVGGVAGHYAHHHAVAGAMAGCVGGHYLAKRNARQKAVQAQGRRAH
jgi:hypothetical protein